MAKVKSITPNEPANFTPEMGNYKALQPFRYWCQKVLPLVYDDSLSYYELLCKVVDYLNKTMEDVETLHGDVTNLHTAYEELQSYVNNYFSTLDVQVEINNKLDSMAESGELYEIIRRYTDPIINEQNEKIDDSINKQNEKINVLETRMNTFTSLPDGSTSGDAELTDIRVGYNGHVYPNAGDAVREQVSGLKGDLVSLAGREIEYELKWVSNEYINGDTGEIISYDGWKRTDYTELVDKDILYVSTTQESDNIYNAFYDENKKFLLKLYVTANSDKALIDYVPKNAKYFILSCNNNVQMNAYPKIYNTEELNGKIEEIDTRVKILENTLPEYYDSYMVEKNNKVNNLMDNIDNCVSFVFLTDQHLYSNAKNSGYMIKNIIENTAVKDVINGGDIISAYGNELSIKDDCEKYNKYWGFLNPYFVRGNHDIYASESDDLTNAIVKPNSMVINRFIRPYFHDDIVIDCGKTYYYFDRPQNKARFIVLDTTDSITKENSTVNFAITQTQIDWFINLLKDTPQGYKIIVCNHIPINSTLSWYTDFTLIFGDIIEAYNAKTTINSQSFNVVANADFSNSNGNVILSICGHGHVDSWNKSDTGCIYYEVNTDSTINNGGSEYDRVVGTTSEQSFDVVIINADNADIYTVRYGAGIDKILILH